MTHISAALVIMDDYCKFITTYMLQTKVADAVTAALKEYFTWAERQIHCNETDNREAKKLNIQFASC